MALTIHTGPGGFPAPQSSSMFRNIAATFVIITVLVIAVVLWTSSVKADITVKVKHEPVNIATSIEISPSPTIGQIQGRVVSGVFTESKEYTVEMTSGTVSVPPAPAKANGRVKIINNYSKAQPLVTNTRLLTTDGRLYRIQNTVNVPSGGSVEVAAASDKEGLDENNLPVGTKLTIPGLWEGLQSQIYAEVVQPFQGPSASGPRRLVTADALVKAHEELYTAALEKGKQTLILEAGADPNWQSVFLVTDTKRQSNAAAGQETDAFLAQVKLTMTAVFFPKNDVVALVRDKLKEKIPEGYYLNDLDMDKLVFSLASADMTRNTAVLNVSADASSQLTADSPALKKDSVVGLPRDEVIRKWSALDGVESVDISLKPDWVSRLPSMKDKINVTIQ